MDKENKKETDWKIVLDGMKTIHLLKVLNEEENIDKTMRQILTETFSDVNDFRVLNKGVLIMAAFLQFAYLEQTKFDKINFDELDFSDFNIAIHLEPISNEYIARKIRNSITHGRFKFIENNILLIQDYYINKKKDELCFEATIPIVKFGEIIDQFAFKKLNASILIK